MAIFEGEESVKVARATTVVLWLLVAFLAVGVVSGLQQLKYIGAGLQATNTISVSGHGEYLAQPDLATFTFSIVSDKAAVADAQADATAKVNAATDYLKSAGVSDKDIQTSDYSVYPQYEYQNAACPMVATQGGTPIYCPPGKQVLKGYEVRQSTTVKVRDTSKAGELLAGVGGKGATEVSGLNFTFDNPDMPQQQARNKAIADAKSKADALAQQLGVSLVRVVSFNENGSGSPRPLVYSMASGATADAKSVAPQISTGQNKTTDDVTVTYEIR